MVPATVTIRSEKRENEKIGNTSENNGNQPLVGVDLFGDSNPKEYVRSPPGEADERGAAAHHAGVYSFLVCLSS